MTEEPEPQGLSEENKTKWKKNKKRKTYGESKQAYYVHTSVHCKSLDAFAKCLNINVPLLILII